MNNTDLELKGRFVKDYNLPIQILFSPYFEYFIDLYQEDYGSKTKWEKLQREIYTRFEDRPGKYLNHFYEIRDKIITDIEGSKKYKDFCEDPDFFTKFAIPGEVKHELYTGDQVNKRFMSIDLRKANFQALKYYNPDLVHGAETYQDFIEFYDESEVLAESKYTRQVIFGKLNAKRQITIEKYIMNKIFEDIQEIIPEEFTLFSKQTDEIIYELPKDYIYIPGKLEEKIKTKVDFEVKVEVFTLGMLQKFTKTGNSILGFYKDYLFPRDKKSTLHRVPGVYFAQMYKMWKEKEIDPTFDLALLYEGQLARFDYPLFSYNNNVNKN